MRVPVQRQRRALRFNITPLIDIVFLLIIFFLVASHFVSSDETELIDLPTAAAASQEPPDIPRRLVITVSAEGTFHVRGRERPDAELDALIATEGATDAAGLEVRIRTDRHALWDRVEEVMLACASAGIQKVRFAVIPEGQ